MFLFGLIFFKSFSQIERLFILQAHVKQAQVLLSIFRILLQQLAMYGIRLKD